MHNWCTREKEKEKKNYVGSETTASGEWHSLHLLRKRRHIGPKSCESPPPACLREWRTSEDLEGDKPLPSEMFGLLIQPWLIQPEWLKNRLIQPSTRNQPENDWINWHFNCRLNQLRFNWTYDCPFDLPVQLTIHLIYQFKLIQPSTRNQPENDWINWCFDWWLKLSRIATATIALHRQDIVQQCVSQ